MRKGYIFTILTLYFVIIFILFLGFTTYFVYKSSNTDKQLVQNNLNYNKFNISQDNISLTDAFKWCSKFFYYDANDSTNGYNNLEYKEYCEGYNAKRFI
jgi:hypothetical protein